MALNLYNRVTILNKLDEPIPAGAISIRIRRWKYTPKKEVAEVLEIGENPAIIAVNGTYSFPTIIDNATENEAWVHGLIETLADFGSLPVTGIVPIFLDDSIDGAVFAQPATGLPKETLFFNGNSYRLFVKTL